MGDSNTAASYPYFLGVLKSTSGLVINDGVSGDITSQMLVRFADNVTSLSVPGDYVIIMGGENDCGGGLDHTIPEANLQSIFDAANVVGLKVVAVTIPPFKNCVYWSAARGVEADYVSAWVRAKPSHVDYVVDIHAAVQDPADHDAINSLYDYGDHLHYNAAGYQLIANTFYNALWPVITSPLSSTGYAPYVTVTTLNVGNLSR